MRCAGVRRVAQGVAGFVMSFSTSKSLSEFKTQAQGGVNLFNFVTKAADVIDTQAKNITRQCDDILNAGRPLPAATQLDLINIQGFMSGIQSDVARYKGAMCVALSFLCFQKFCFYISFLHVYVSHASCISCVMPSMRCEGDRTRSNVDDSCPRTHVDRFYSSSVYLVNTLVVNIVTLLSHAHVKRQCVMTAHPPRLLRVFQPPHFALFSTFSFSNHSVPSLPPFPFPFFSTHTPFSLSCCLSV